jgi:hypothetical protein
VQKLKSAPTEGFTLEKKLFNLPQVLINAELYGLVIGPKAEKKRIPSKI